MGDNSRRRADEIIAIADGRKTLEESRAANAEANKAYRERKKETAQDANRYHVTANLSEKPNENNDRPHKAAG